MSRQVIGPVERLDEIDSTNRYLADAARAGAPGGSVAIARYQTAGRGRLDRRWEAPPGTNLLMSVLLRPEAPEVEPFHFTVATALAAAAACRESAGVDPGLKWPNDLVVAGRPLPPGAGADYPRRDLKLAGILAELVSSPDGNPAIVVGLGLNVCWPGPEPGEPEMKTATSLVRLSDRPLDPDSISEVVLDHLDRRISDLSLQGGAALQMGQYRKRCVTIGQTVRVERPGASFIGRAERITDEGHLMVYTWVGGYEEVTAGDVVHVHPGDHQPGDYHGVGLSGAP